MPARRQRTEVDPKVTANRTADSDFVQLVDVELAAGQYVYASRDPIWFSEGLIARPVDSGVRWESPAGGSLSFGSKDATNLNKLDIGDSPYVVATDLIVLWTADVRFEPLDMPELPGFARVSGDGILWLLLPGYSFAWPYWRIRIGSAVADPARLAWVKTAAATLEMAPGPGGRPWVRLGPGTKASVHSWPRVAPPSLSQR